MLKKEYLFSMLVFLLFIISSVSAEEMDDSSSNVTDIMSVNAVEIDELDNQYPDSNSENEAYLDDRATDEVLSGSDVDLDHVSSNGDIGISSVLLENIGSIDFSNGSKRFCEYKGISRNVW